MNTYNKSKERKKLESLIGKELFNTIPQTRHVCQEIKNRGYFLSFFVTNLVDTNAKEEKVDIYLDTENFIVFSDNALAKKIVEEMDSSLSAKKALVRFFTNLTKEDIDHLEKIENDINELELKIITTDKAVKGASARIVQLRHSLFRIKRFYEQLSFLIDGLSLNENNFFDKSELEYLSNVVERLKYLIKSVVELREFVTQVREAYQAKIDIEQNQTMKILTVITSIFLPLTLIVGWYGMNFAMPEYAWKGGYIYVICLSAIVFVVSLIIFKRKKWF